MRPRLPNWKFGGGSFCLDIWLSQTNFVSPVAKGLYVMQIYRINYFSFSLSTYHLLPRGSSAETTAENCSSWQTKRIQCPLVKGLWMVFAWWSGAEVTGSNPVEALIFFRLLPSNCLNWKINCDDHSSLSNLIKYNIDRTSETSLCRLCGDATGTVRHIVNGCKKLTRERIGSVTTWWPCGYTGRCAGSMG